MSDRGCDVVCQIVGRGEEFDGLLFDLVRNASSLAFLSCFDVLWRPGMVFVNDKTEDGFAKFLRVVKFLLGDGNVCAFGDVSVAVRVNANK